MNAVAVLFVTPRSVYKSIPGVDCYDLERDARTFDLSCPVVAHPPCRMWGNYAQWAKGRPDERDLAHWAVHAVRHCGGVLEHPITSRLWREIQCLGYGLRDRFGGVLLPIKQSWFGHRAPKETGLYVVGPVPEMFFRDDGSPFHFVERMGAPERMRTPPDLAHWLVNVARAAA